MSTKTLRKRIALVAVAALGFGVLSTAPSSAAVTAATISAGTTAAGLNGNVSATTGKQASASIRIFSTTGDSDAITIAAALTSTTAATVPTERDAIASGDFALPIKGEYYLKEAADSVVATKAFTAAPANKDVAVTPTAAISAAVTVATLYFTPAAAGQYVFTISEDITNGGDITITFNVTSPTASDIVMGSVARSDLDYTEVTAVDNRAAAEGDSVVIRCLSDGLGSNALYQWTQLPTAVAGLTALGTLGAYTACGTSSVNLKYLVTTETTLYGTYKLRTFVDGNGDGAYSLAEDGAATDLSFVVALDAAGAKSLSLTRTSFAPDGNTAIPFQLTYSQKDSKGNASYLAASDAANTWTVTDAAGNAVAALVTAFTNGDSGADYGAPSLPGNTAAGTYTVGVVGPGGTLATNGSTATFTVVSSAGTADAIQVDAAAGLVLDSTTAGKVASVNNSAAELGTITASTTAAKAITFKFSVGNYLAGSARNVPVTVTVLTGSLVNTSAPALATVLPDGTGSFAVTNSAPASGDSYRVTIPTSHLANADGDLIGFTVTYSGNIPSFSAVSKAPAAAFTVKTGSTNTVSATLDDTFGTALASKTVTVTVTGRNPSTSQVTSDAAGKVSFTLADAGAVATATTDTVKFDHAYISAAGAAATATTSFVITYTATGLVIGVVKVTATATPVVDTVQLLGVNSAAATVTYTATVTDDAGLPINNAVVLWTSDADTKLAKSASATDGVGQATVTATRTKIGYATVTATVSAVAGSHTTILWTTTAYANGATDVFRNVTLSADPKSAIAGGTIRYTATVTDRWGNPVVNVPLTLRLTGAGRLVTGEVTSGAAVKTAIDGTFQWNVTTLNAETGTSTATVTIAGGQSADLAGFVSVAGVTNAVAGVTAGNTTAAATGTFTKDTSTSTADALLALAQALGTRDQASATVDAAAEATDAANAATDAANYAAEAADAATAAAQDASDAVAALSAQVSEAIAGLKKQLVSLTNLVIKIQKKVKA